MNNKIKEYDTRLRSAIKTITWRVLATLTTITLVLIFTNKLTIALSIGFFEVISKFILYYFHERLWNYFEYGKKIIKES